MISHGRVSFSSPTAAASGFVSTNSTGALPRFVCANTHGTSGPSASAGASCHSLKAGHAVVQPRQSAGRRAAAAAATAALSAGPAVGASGGRPSKSAAREPGGEGAGLGVGGGCGAGVVCGRSNMCGQPCTAIAAARITGTAEAIATDQTRMDDRCCG
eukprot:scaffold35235_cov63-Phaeocystis_antarctica.AAC.2